MLTSACEIHSVSPMQKKSLVSVLSSARDNITEYFNQISPPVLNRVPLNLPTFGADEVLEALESLLSQNVTMGKKVARFEEEFAAYSGVRHAIMVNSGSSANLLIMAAASNPLRDAKFRLSPGDEILVPAVTWSTTLWPVIQMGCVPVLVDAEINTLNMSVDAARKAIGPKTRGIFLAHILGNAADMDGFRALAMENNLILFEDSCEALGTTYKEKKTGSFSTAASFSFFFSHHITTIEGGMVVTDDDQFADLCRCLRAHGWARHMHSRATHEQNSPNIDPRFLFVNIGYNLRPTEIQAAFGIHQLPKLEGFNRRRREIAEYLLARLSHLSDQLDFVEPTEGVVSTWFGFPVLLSSAWASHKAALVEHLELNGIETRPIIAGNLAVQPALKLFEHRVAGELPNAQAIMGRGVYWGSHPLMENSELDYVVKTLNDFFEGRPRE